MKKSRLLSALAATTLASAVAHAEPRTSVVELETETKRPLPRGVEGFPKGIILPDLELPLNILDLLGIGGFPKGIPVNPNQ